MKLSVIIATHNEEENIGKCLDAVRDLADEILVADGESTDRTREIAKERGATVLPMTNKRMFHFNKEEAREKATGEWVLFLDADEIITPELAQDIRQVLDGKEFSVDSSLFERHMRLLEARDGILFSRKSPITAYFIARKTYFLGGYLMHSGDYPNGVIRLVRKGKGYWPCKDVHETMAVTGGVSWLPHPMIHLSDPTFSRYLERANRYTTLTADSLQQTATNRSIFTLMYFLFLKPTQTFFLLFFRHKGFMDGYPGFVWALMSGLHWPIAYMKFRALT